MKDKIIKILKIKIDAINRNIDNLNYLNGELDKNNEDLNYIKDKINLFQDNEILDFDKIEKNDFEKLLSMLDEDITVIFNSTACNYDGILYIIKGIRQGINLVLTNEQKESILSFKNALSEKEKIFVSIIEDLNESKDRLPEDNLDILKEELNNYLEIISNLENDIYLTEIDDIVNALEFSKADVIEKIEIFEYLLNYNANIYEKEKPRKEETIEEDLNDNNINNIIEEQDITSNIKNNLDDLNYSFDETYNFPTFYEETKKTDKINEEENVENDLDISDELPTLNNLGFNSEEEKNVLEEKEILNTVDLEDIIKKIDEKLKDLEEKEIKEEEKNNNTEDTLEKDELKDDFSSYNLNIGEFENYNINNDLSIKNNIDNEKDDNLNDDFSFKTHEIELNVEKENEKIEKILKKNNLENILNDINNSISDIALDNLLNSLNENKILNLLEENIIIEIINNNIDLNLSELLELIKDNFVNKNMTYDYVLNIICSTMPLLFTKKELIINLSNNINFFKEHNLNLIHIFNNYRELLIVENEILCSNYSIVSDYNLTINNDNVKYLLYNNDLFKKLDSYIEAIGYEKGFLGVKEVFDGIEYINKNPYKINDINSTVLMKLRFSSENDKKIFGSKPGILSGEISNSKVDLLELSEDYKNLYFNYEYPFLEKDEVDKLFNEIDSLKENNLIIDEMIKKLDSSYKISNLKYKIGNNIFSRIKTIRIYNYLKEKDMNLNNALIIALTYNSVIKRDEFINVSNFVNALEGGIK